MLHFFLVQARRLLLLLLLPVSSTSSSSSSSVMSLDMYVIGDVIGKGSFGVVRMAQLCDTPDKGTWPFAIKDIDMRRVRRAETRRSLQREVNILKMVHGQSHMVSLVEAFQHNNHQYLVLERIDTHHKDLFDDIVHSPGGLFAPDQALSVFAQIVSAVAWCDLRGVYHRDLKPENILLDRHGCARLVDFGFAKHILPVNPVSVAAAAVAAAAAAQCIAPPAMHTACGSPHYASPELLACDGQHSLDTNEVWSLGVLLFAMVAGTMPFDDANRVMLIEKILDAEYIIPDHVPPPIAELIRSMLVVDTHTRITIQQLNAHPLVRLHFDLYQQSQQKRKPAVCPFPPPLSCACSQK
jgi:serine/threonine protein kinase